MASDVRAFVVERSADPSGISGTGRVAVGAVMPTGAVALTWLTSVESKTWFDSLDDFLLVHVHPGTRIRFDDDPDRPIEGGVL